MPRLTVNGRSYDIDADPNTPLLWALREQVGLTGTKYGCGIAQCGACTVHVDGIAMRSCSLPVSEAEGKQITTIEGLGQNKHLAASLAEEHELTKRQGQALLNDLVGLITKHLKKGERIRIAGFGILQVRKRPARMGRNPATGEAIKIKASKKVAFRASKELKLAV
jgi:DNA-binding protein HU-beta